MPYVHFSHYLTLFDPGFALFRALLRQKNRLPVGEQRTSLESQLRVTFHKNTREQSPRAIVAALRQGYELLKILNEGAIKRPDSSSQIPDFVATPILRRQTYQPTKLPLSEQKSNITTSPSQFGPRVWPHPDTISIQNRPFLTVPGRRRVPHLVNGNGFPFLRFKKPQSPYLSRLIRDNLHASVKRINRVEQLRALIELGNHEDKWDECLGLTSGLVRGERDFSWALEAKRGLSKLLNLHERIKKRRADMGQKMHEIAEKEQVLANKEKANRRSEKNRERYLRRLAQKASSSQKVEDPQKISLASEAM